MSTPRCRWCGAAAARARPRARTASAGHAHRQPGRSSQRSDQEVDALNQSDAHRVRATSDIPIDDIRRNPAQPAQSVFDEDALVELTHSIREFGLLQPIVVRDVPGGGYELVMGERRWRAGATRRPDDHPGDRPPHRGRRPAPGRAAGEHPPGEPEPAGRGGGLPAVARGVRRHPGGAGLPAGPQPTGHLQHHPVAEAARSGAAPGRGRGAVRRARQGIAVAARSRTTRSSWRRGSSPRVCRSAAPRRR